MDKGGYGGWVKMAIGSIRFFHFSGTDIQVSLPCVGCVFFFFCLTIFFLTYAKSSVELIVTTSKNKANATISSLALLHGSTWCI